MKIQTVMFVLLGMMFLFARVTSARQVTTDYDRSAHFAEYRTYSWLHVETRDPLSVDRIKHAVNATLAAKGWTQVDSGADVSIVALEITRDQQTLDTFYDGVGGGWGWTYKVGTVVIDLFDTRTKQLLWRGAASDTLSDNSNTNIKNLDEGVDRMFKQFPPSATKK